MYIIKVVYSKIYLVLLGCTTSTVCTRLAYYWSIRSNLLRYFFRSSKARLR